MTACMIDHILSLCNCDAALTQSALVQSPFSTTLKLASLTRCRCSKNEEPRRRETSRAVFAMSSPVGAHLASPGSRDGAGFGLQQSLLPPREPHNGKCHDAPSTLRATDIALWSPSQARIFVPCASSSCHHHRVRFFPLPSSPCHSDEGHPVTDARGHERVYSVLGRRGRRGTRLSLPLSLSLTSLTAVLSPSLSPTARSPSRACRCPFSPCVSCV